MGEFTGCDKCKNVNKRPHEEPCVNCTHNAQEHFAPMTNADRIRNMTDDELAEFICDFSTCDICTDICDTTTSCNRAGAIVKIAKWLQAEVKEGESNADTE